jgi:hypothetical protein
MNILCPKITFRRSYTVSGLTFAVITMVFIAASECQAAPYTLTVTANHGSVTVTPEKTLYNEGEIVELITRPDISYCFTGWSGNAHGKRLVLNLTMDGNKTIVANFGPWQPPIGIPMPEFGIFETYRMYDVAGNRNDSLTYYQNTEGGYYTHYVDNTDPNSTDAGNLYGTFAKPRKTLPSTSYVPPGSVVEIHGGPYTETYWLLTINGTSSQPIFVRGLSKTIRPIVNSEVRLRGHYIILENIDFDKDQRLTSAVIARPQTVDEQVHHVAVRGCEVHNFGRGDTGSPVTMMYAISYLAGITVENVVFYANDIHPDNMLPPDATYENDTGGIYLFGSTSKIWVVDNHIHHIDGDCIGGGHGANYTVHDCYVGRNVLHDAVENALDFKEIENIVISENVMYNMAAGSEGQAGGVAAVVHYGPDDAPKNLWMLYNDIYDSNACGIQISGNEIHPVYIIGNVIHDIRSGIIKPYIFERFDQGGAFIYSKLRLKGYVDANGVVDPAFTAVDNEFKSWFPEGYDQFAYIDQTLLHTRDRGEIATAYRSWDSSEVYFIGNTIYRCDNGPDSDVPRSTSKLVIVDNIIADIGANRYHLSLDRDRTRAEVTNNLFYEPSGQTRIRWYDRTYDLTQFQSNTGKGQGCLEADPLFVNSKNNDFSLQAGSPAIDAGVEASVYQLFQDTFGIDIQVDRNGRPRPHGSAWDIGAYEYTLGAVTDLSVPGTSQNSITFTWIVPGEEGVTGKPTRYDIRYSGSPLTEANWDAATQVQGEPVPGDFGEQQSFTISGLNPGTTYYVAIKTADDGGHTSQLSNVASGTTATSGNHAPVLALIGDRSVVENGTLTFQISATDADGDALSYSATNLPVGASFTPATRIFTWIPTNTQSGTYRVTFQVTDGQVTVSETVKITVRETPNQSPVLEAVGDKIVNENASLSFSIKAADPDGDALTYSATGLPSGATFASQVFSWIPSYDQAGSYLVTFSVSDGELTDDEKITITVVNVTDMTAPSAHDFYPLPDSIQAPLNCLISFTISDGGWGVDANTVTLHVNDQLVYSGDKTVYESAYGVCRRTGTRASYRYYYQPAHTFDFDQQVSVRVNASDMAHNAMIPVSYQFKTEMRSFGQNKKVASGSDTLAKGSPSTVADSAGNIWVTWESGTAGSRDIYVGKLTSGADNFDSSIRLTESSFDQCNPAIAVGSDDKLYVVWQDNRRGNWDIYASVSADGITWSTGTLVVDSNNNEVNPAVAIDNRSPNRAYVVWQDDRNGNQDIYIAASSNSFLTAAVSQITSNSSDQIEPAIAIGSSNAVYVIWTDNRGGSSDIYGAASNYGSWTNVPIVNNASNQTKPAIAVESAEAKLHILWVDGRSGNQDIYYATSDGLPGSPLSGSSIIDDTSAAKQSEPVIITNGSSKVFACWQDERNVAANGGDTDLYMAELTSDSRTNILVGDDGTNSNQSEPAIGVGEYGHPYLVWAYGRSANTEIYYAASIFVEPVALKTKDVLASLGATVGTDPASITSVNDVSVVVPAGACLCDIKIAISKMKNPQAFTFAKQCLGGYDFGPSGMQFSQPVTVTIPYTPSGSGTSASAYWYNSLTGALSQQGISGVQDIVISPTLHALQFKTTHFTPFYLLLAGGRGGGGGGGCSMSVCGEGDIDIVGFLLPYVGLAVVVLVLKLRDRRNRKVHGIT